MSTLKSKFISAPVNGATVEPLVLQTNNLDRLTIDSAGNGTFGGTLDVTGGVNKLSSATGSAPSYSARAWVNFNGTGTVAIRASGNVSSITDNGTGNYRMNFATAMPDANYAGVGSTQGSGVSVLPVISINQDNDQTTTFVDIYTTGGSTATPSDFLYVGVSIFR